MKLNRYRFEGKYVASFPLEALAFEYGNGFHDDRCAVIEKEINDTWYERGVNGDFWFDGINIVSGESNEDLEWEICQLWLERERLEDTEKRAEIEQNIAILQEKQEKLWAATNYNVGFDITQENIDKVSHILAGINKGLNLAFPLGIKNGTLKFAAGRFVALHPSFAYYITEIFHEKARQFGLK